MTIAGNFLRVGTYVYKFDASGVLIKRLLYTAVAAKVVAFKEYDCFAHFNKPVCVLIKKKKKM